MIWIGLILIIVGFILGLVKLGSQLIDLFKFDFSKIGDNLLWILFSIGLIVIGIIVFVIGIVVLIFG